MVIYGEDNRCANERNGPGKLLALAGDLRRHNRGPDRQDVVDVIEAFYRRGTCSDLSTMASTTIRFLARAPSLVTTIISTGWLITHVVMHSSKPGLSNWEHDTVGIIIVTSRLKIR